MAKNKETQVKEGDVAVLAKQKSALLYYVVVKSAPKLMASASGERIVLFAVIVVRSCCRFLEGFVCSRVLYCNSCEGVCQEVSGVNIWDAVIIEKG